MLFREKERATLYSYIVSGWPLIELVGQAGTGKHMLLATVVSQLPPSYATISVDLLECPTANHVYGEVLRRLPSTKRTIKELTNEESSCTSHVEFVTKLDAAVKTTKTQRLVIVLDNAEELATAECNLAYLLPRLGELVKGLSITIVCVARVSLDLRLKLTFAPLRLCLPAYSKDQLINILSVRPPADWNSRFYLKYALNQTYRRQVIYAFSLQLRHTHCFHSVSSYQQHIRHEVHLRDQF